MPSGGPSFGVVVFRLETPLKDRLEASGVRVFPPQQPLMRRRERLRHVDASVRAFRPDLIHTTLFEADLAGRVLGRIRHVPVVTSLVNVPYVHIRQKGLDGHPRNPVKFRAVEFIDGLLARHATSAFHAVSEAVAAASARALRISRADIHVVPRGRSQERLGEPSHRRRMDTRRRLNVGDRTPLLLNVGREEPQKGQVDAVEALARIRPSRPGACLVIAGRSGRSSGILDQRVDDLSLQGAVLRLGRRDDIGDLLCAADVLVFPSRYEGLPGAVLEAMALETPIVAADIPAVREAVSGESGALLTPPGNVDRLAEGVEAALSDRSATRARAARARQRFEAVYTLDACVQGMLDLYERVARE